MNFNVKDWFIILSEKNLKNCIVDWQLSKYWITMFEFVSNHVANDMVILSETPEGLQSIC